MIVCPECGAEVEAHRRRCAECGHALAATERRPVNKLPADQQFLSDDDFLPVEAAVSGAGPNVGEPGAVRTPGVWRQGNLLVVRKGATLPPWCVKTHQPAEVTLTRTMYWHHPSLYLLIIIGLLIYAIVALIVRKKAVVQIGLTRQRLSRRRWGIAVGWLIALGGLGLIFTSAAVGNTHTEMVPYLVIGGFVCIFVIGPIYGLLRSQLISPKRITDEYVWIKGVHPWYLAELREFPGEGGVVIG